MLEGVVSKVPSKEVEEFVSKGPYTLVATHTKGKLMWCVCGVLIGRFDFHSKEEASVIVTVRFGLTGGKHLLHHGQNGHLLKIRRQHMSFDSLMPRVKRNHCFLMIDHISVKVKSHLTFRKPHSKPNWMN